MERGVYPSIYTSKSGPMDLHHMPWAPLDETNLYQGLGCSQSVLLCMYSTRRRWWVGGAKWGVSRPRGVAQPPLVCGPPLRCGDTKVLLSGYVLLFLLLMSVDLTCMWPHQSLCSHPSSLRENTSWSKGGELIWDASHGLWLSWKASGPMGGQSTPMGPTSSICSI
jgi:hypothetical protein